jgi:hypothetical protein
MQSILFRILILSLWSLTALHLLSLEDPEVTALGASRSGENVAYVLRDHGVRRQALWLRTKEGDKQLLSWEDLKKINYLYNAAVGNLQWSPSERYISFDVWDGDVEVVSSLYDVETGKVEILHPKEGNGYHATWHPREDWVFFKAGRDEGQQDPTLYWYDLRTGKKGSVYLAPGVQHFQPTEAALARISHE